MRPMHRPQIYEQLNCRTPRSDPRLPNNFDYARDRDYTRDRDRDHGRDRDRDRDHGRDRDRDYSLGYGRGGGERYQPENKHRRHNSDNPYPQQQQYAQQQYFQQIAPPPPPPPLPPQQQFYQQPYELQPPLPPPFPPQNPYQYQRPYNQNINNEECCIQQYIKFICYFVLTLIILSAIIYGFLRWGVSSGNYTEQKCKNYVKFQNMICRLAVSVS